MNNIAIKVSHLTKVYKLYDKPIDRLKESLHPLKKQYHKDFYALNDVSFEIKKGETVGIIGKNGAGKSTLLKIITGVLTPSNGHVHVNGRIASLLELGAGFNPEYTGIENIYLQGTLMGYSHSEMESKIDEILAFADIGDFVHQAVKMYSSGMFARLAFAVAINVDPDILIVDEALSVGDMKFQLKCMEKFNDFRKAKKTILFVTHDMNAIRRFCTFSIWIKNGQLSSQGKVEFVVDRYVDYLKIDDNIDKKIDTKVYNQNIAEILNCKIIQDNNETSDIEFGKAMKVEISYKVYDLTIKQPIIGVAIHSIDNSYICGLNTLFDKFQISWNLGLNKIVLEYEEINLVGGSYYLDIALFDDTGSIVFDYKTKEISFIIHMPIIGEGICILNHSWKVGNNE